MRVINVARTLLLIAVLACVTTTETRGQCAQPNGNDQLSDTAAIQCLLDQGGTIDLAPGGPYGYYIGPPGLILRQSGTTLRGNTPGTPTLLLAAADLTTPILEVENGGVSGYTLTNLFFYGNRFNLYECGLHDR